MTTIHTASRTDTEGYANIVKALKAYAQPGIIGVTSETLIDLYSSLAALSRRIDALEAKERQSSGPSLPAPASPPHS